MLLSKGRFSYTNLYFENRSKLDSANRDLAQLEAYGISAELLEKANALGEQLVNFPTDAELEGQQMIATTERNSEAEKLRNAIRRILSRVGYVFGNKSEVYAQFRSKSLATQKMTALAEVGMRVSRLFDLLQADLINQTFTAMEIDAFNEQLLTYTESIDTQERAKKNRDLATQQRRSIAGTLYYELQYICNVGKQVWRGVNEAKYNDYLLYDSPPKKVTEPVSEPAEPVMNEEA